MTSIASDLPFLVSAQFAPFLLVALSIIYVMVLKILRMSFLPICAGVGVFLAASWLISMGDFNKHHAHGLAFNSITRMAFLLLLPAIFGICLMIGRQNAQPDKKVASLLMVLISFVGGMVVLTSNNWLMFFVGVQCMSIPIYGLLAFDTDNKVAVAAAAKYLILSIVAMAFMLFGIMLLYAASGSMEFSAIRHSHLSTLILFGLALVLVGIGFKISIVPFHIWAPDVYQGASLFVTSYLLVVVKAVMVFFLAANYFAIVGHQLSSVSLVLSTLAVLSMWIGNGLMLTETNFFRLLGFLSIGHLGFLIIPLLSDKPSGVEAVFLDLASFGLAILLTLSTIKWMSPHELGSWKIDDFRGLMRNRPWCALVLIIGLATLAGLPLTAGFIGKYAILRASVDNGMWFLSINVVASSVLGIMAIARIMMVMAEQVPVVAVSPRLTWGGRGILTIYAIALLWFGIFPEPWINWVKTEASSYHHSRHLP